MSRPMLEFWGAMSSTVFGFRSFFIVWAVVVGLMIALAWPSRAGDGTIVHVGETTEMVLDGAGWTLDPVASRKANLVSVSAVAGSRVSSRFAIRGLKPGQVELVFRRGPETFRAFIDVLK